MRIRNSAWRLRAGKSQKKIRNKSHVGLGDRHDSGMKFPNRAYLRGTAIVIEIFKRHAEHLNRQGLRQVSAVLRIQLETVLCELRLCGLPCTAILAVHWSLHDDAGRGLVGGL